MAESVSVDALLSDRAVDAAVVFAFGVNHKVERGSPAWLDIKRQIEAAVGVARVVEPVEEPEPEVVSVPVRPVPRGTVGMVSLLVTRPGLVADLAAVLRVLVADGEFGGVSKARARARVLLREIENG